MPQQLADARRNTRRPDATLVFRGEPAINDAGVTPDRTAARHGSVARYHSASIHIAPTAAKAR